MNLKTLRGRAVVGMAAGAMMAMFSMVAMAAAGDGFWTPVNLIAHTVWDGAPLDGEFSGGGLVLGMVVHMMLSMMLGIIVVQAAERLGRGALASGMLVAAVAYVGQLIVWPVVAEPAFEAYTPWVLLVGHVMFGMVAGLAAGATLGKSDSR